MHLQRQSGHQRRDGHQAGGEQETRTPRSHVRNIPQSYHTQDGTDEKRIADSSLHPGRVPGLTKQLLEDNIGRVRQGVLEAVAEVGDVLTLLALWMRDEEVID